MNKPSQIAVKIEAPETGVFEMSIESYHQHEAISNTGLGYILKSPAHYIAYRNQPPEATTAQIIGSATHAGILEPALFKERYASMPEGLDRRTKIGKQTYEDLQASGKMILPHTAFQNIQRMIEEAYSHPTVSTYLKGGVTERSFFWKDKETGVSCKSRPDYLRKDGIIVDLKTTDSASLVAFQKSVANYAYYRQAAFAMDGLKAVLGVDQVGFVLIAIEKEPPYAIAIFILDSDAIAAGRLEYQFALNTYANCLKTDRWPGYTVETQTLSLPGWMK